MHEIHPYRKEHHHSRLLTIESIVYLAFVVFLFLLSGAVTNANPAAVLLAFAPALAFGIILVLLVETDHFNPSYNWLVLVIALVISAIIYYAIPSPLVQGIDAGTVLFMNALLMAVSLVILHNSYSHEHPLHGSAKEHRSHVQRHDAETVVHHVHHVESATEVADVVHSIEDKVKALNFAIGRVYSVYHGGTERMRSKIRIDKSWYDEFTQIPEDDLERRRHEAIVLVQKIKDRLDVLEQPEKAVFGADVSSLKNIEHATDGSNTVIAVLVKNDKDPVQGYFDGSRVFCEEALSALRADSHTHEPTTHPRPFAAHTSPAHTAQPGNKQGRH